MRLSFGFLILAFCAFLVAPGAAHAYEYGNPYDLFFGQPVYEPEAEPVEVPWGMEAGCIDCDLGHKSSYSNRSRLRRSGREIARAARKARYQQRLKARSRYARTAAIESAEEREYDEIEGASAADGEEPTAQIGSGFVARLLKSAVQESNRTCRHTSRGYRCKRSSKGLGMCLQGVRMALQRAAGRSTRGGIGTRQAKHAGPYLRKFGFRKAPAGRYTPETAPVGSILVYDAPRERYKAGHIEIKGTNGYYSDYFHRQPISSYMHGRRRLIGIYLPPQS